MAGPASTSCNNQNLANFCAAAKRLKDAGLVGVTTIPKWYYGTKGRVGTQELKRWKTRA